MSTTIRELMPDEAKAFAALELPTLADILTAVLTDKQADGELYRRTMHEIGLRYKSYDHYEPTPRVAGGETYTDYAERQFETVMQQLPMVDIEATSDFVLIPVAMLEDDFDDDDRPMFRIACEQALYKLDALPNYVRYANGEKIDMLDCPPSGWGWELDDWKRTLAHKVWVPSHFSFPQQVAFIADCFMELTFCGTTYESSVNHQSHIADELEETKRTLDEAIEANRLDEVTTTLDLDALDTRDEFEKGVHHDAIKTIAKLWPVIEKERLDDLTKLAELVIY